MRQVGFAYAHVRLQARLSSRPSALDWQMIETGRDFAQTLDAAKQGALARFVTRLSRESDLTAVEHALRQSWGELVAEVAAWVPAKWRDALLWIAPLPYLRLVEARQAPELSGASELEEATADGTSVSEAWRAGFRARLPAPEAGLDDAIAPLLDRYLEGPPRPSTDTADLSARLETLFRERPQQPAAVVAWLGLMAFVFARLQGALLLAMLYPSRPVGAEL